MWFKRYRFKLPRSTSNPNSHQLCPNNLFRWKDRDMESASNMIVDIIHPSTPPNPPLWERHPHPTHNNTTEKKTKRNKANQIIQKRTYEQNQTTQKSKSTNRKKWKGNRRLRTCQNFQYDDHTCADDNANGEIILSESQNCYLDSDGNDWLIKILIMYLMVSFIYIYIYIYIYIWNHEIQYIYPGTPGFSFITMQCYMVRK